MTARKPISRSSDMVSERPEKAPNLNAPTKTIGPWTPPAESDRQLARAGLERRGLGDVAEILGLVDPQPATGPLAVPCPTCGAAAGAHCITTAVRSRLVEGHHRARQEAA